MHRTITLCCLAAAFVGSLAAAQIIELPPPEEKKPKVKTAYTGEITELSDSSFRIRPWDPKLPSRVQVTATQGTRYLRQVEGQRRDIKPGDIVLVVEDPRPAIRLPGKKEETEEERQAREARLKELRAEAEKTPGRSRAVLRMWPAPEGLVTPDDQESGEALLTGARAHFKGGKRGGVRPVKSDTARWVGLVKTLEPLTILVGKEEKVFETSGETVWLDHLPLRPEDLKKGRTVVVRTPTPLGADGTLQALLIAQCKEPDRNPSVERKLILRERGARK